MTIAVGFVFTMVCMLGGFMAMGGKVGVLFQPWEFVIICGASFGTFIVANPMPVIKDTGKAIKEAFTNKAPKQEDYLDIIGILFNLMQEIKAKTRAEIEGHIDNPEESLIFQMYPTLLKDKDKVSFITDYVRLIILGNAKPHEVEGLMDEEIHTITKDKLKPYQSLQTVSDGLPAIGIVAAVLGVIKAMGSLDKPPEYLGALIAAALVGTFAGIFMSYCMTAPVATKVKVVREKQAKQYIIIKQTLIAFVSGATPHIAIEYGRKTISAKDRPSIEMVEERTMNSPVGVAAE